MGCTRVFVLSAAPTVSPLSTNGVHAPRSSPGSSNLPTRTDLAHPNVGRLMRSPTCEAMPTLRGCASPCPSNITASGSVFNFAHASKTEGVSRNDNKPGTYGKRVSLTTPTSSITSSDGRRNTTMPAYTTGSNLLKEMSAPAMVSAFFLSGTTRTRSRRRFCNSTASRGASDHSCSCSKLAISQPLFPELRRELHSFGSVDARVLLNYRMHAPALVVARGEVNAEVRAARLLAPQRR